MGHDGAPDFMGLYGGKYLLPYGRACLRNLFKLVVQVKPKVFYRSSGLMAIVVRDN